MTGFDSRALTCLMAIGLSAGFLTSTALAVNVETVPDSPLILFSSPPKVAREFS